MPQTEHEVGLFKIEKVAWIKIPMIDENAHAKQYGGSGYPIHRSGGIDADHISGELITSTSGGSIDLNDVGGNIKASTSGGGIYANISTIDSYLNLSASSGNIKVDMPMSKGMDMDIEAQRVSYSGLKNFDGEIEKDRIYGKLNGGGAKVRIHAGSGNVNINK